MFVGKNNSSIAGMERLLAAWDIDGPFTTNNMEYVSFICTNRDTKQTKTYLHKLTADLWESPTQIKAMLMPEIRIGLLGTQEGILKV